MIFYYPAESMKYVWAKVQEGEFQAHHLAEVGSGRVKNTVYRELEGRLRGLWRCAGWDSMWSTAEAAMAEVLRAAISLDAPECREAREITAEDFMGYAVQMDEREALRRNIEIALDRFADNEITAEDFIASVIE